MEYFTKKPLEGKFGDITDQALGIKNALYEFNPGKCLLFGPFEGLLKQIRDVSVRKDDVWMVSYPKTGSTWCQEIIWLLNNNLNFDEAQSTYQQIRAPLLESSVILFQFIDQFADKFTNSVDYVNELPSPRSIKTHLAFPLLPTEIENVKPKIIYTMRNPKDVCVSFYYQCKFFHGFDVDFETFCELFLNDAVVYGGLFNHYLQFWNRRHEKHILILKYEDMKKDTRTTVKRIAQFMEKPVTDEDLDRIVEFVQFKNMKENKGCNCVTIADKMFTRDGIDRPGFNLMRKGEIGDYKNHMSSEMSKRFDKWVEDNTKGTGLVFD